MIFWVGMLKTFFSKNRVRLVLGGRTICFLWLSCLFVICSEMAAFSADFTEEIEKDLPLRSIGRLQITNMRGEINVQGWAFDKIRIRAKKIAQADTPEQAKALFAAMDFRYRMIDGDIELSAEYGRGLDIEQRLKERESPKTSMEMTVFAPARLRLHVWATDGKVNLKGWHAPVEVRTAAGPIAVENLRGGNVSLLCSSCGISAKNLSGSLRAMGGSEDIEIVDVDGPNVYLESSSGTLRVTRVKGEQLYVSRSGSLVGSFLQGQIEFHLQQGSVDISDVNGFLSGRSDTGSIHASVKKWKFLDKALLETVSGDITLSLPPDFSGDVDCWSQTGKSEVYFPVVRPQESRIFGPEPINRILGRVGDGGELLKIFSEKGNLKLSRGNERMR